MAKVPVFHEDTYYEIPLTEEELKTHKDQNDLERLLSEKIEAQLNTRCALIPEDEDEISAVNNYMNKNQNYLGIRRSNEEEYIEDEEDTNKSDTKSKIAWSHKAVLLLLELAHEREAEFGSGKRHADIWNAIGKEIKKITKLDITGQQCTVKLAGLKRTYKTIKDANNKSGNAKTTWPFYSVMENLYGKKGWIQPLAVASSEGPSGSVNRPTENTINSQATRASSSGSLGSSFREDEPKKKRKRLDMVFGEFLNEMRDARNEREVAKAQRHEERKEERAQLLEILRVIAEK